MLPPASLLPTKSKNAFIQTPSQLSNKLSLSIKPNGDAAHPKWGHPNAGRITDDSIPFRYLFASMWTARFDPRYDWVSVSYPQGRLVLRESLEFIRGYVIVSLFLESVIGAY